MILQMLKTMRGSPDGIKVNTYEAGIEYDFSNIENLAKVFIKNKWAVITKVNPEKKSLNEIKYENKAIENVKENKIIESSITKKLDKEFSEGLEITDKQKDEIKPKIKKFKKNRGK